MVPSKKKSMKYTFSRGAKTNHRLAAELINFFLTHSEKKLLAINQDGYEFDPMITKNIGDDPLKAHITYTIADIYQNGNPEKVAGTVLYLYFGNHPPIGDKHAIAVSEGGTVEFFPNSFTIKSKEFQGFSDRTLTVRKLGFENVDFE